MSLELDLAQTVAIGSFNPAIITPDWVCRWAEMESLDSLDELPLSDDWVDDFVTKGLRWTVEETSLTVSSASRFDSDCGEAVAKVAGALPHTPIEAIEHNFHFTCVVAEWQTDAVPKLGPRELPLLSSADQVRWSAQFARPDGWTEVSLILPRDPEGYALVVVTTHHRIDEQDFEARQKRIAAAARSYTNDLRDTLRLVRDLFSVSIKDAPCHP